MKKCKTDLTTIAAIFLVLASWSMTGCSLIKQIKNGPAPKTNYVPDSSPEFFALAVKFKKLGQAEKSRQYVAKAVKVDPDGEFGHKAKEFEKLFLPKYKVDYDAEQRNAVGVNQIRQGKFEDAINTFEALIKEYPKFEWPYCNLAFIMYKQKEIKPAKDLLNRAIKINHNYLNAYKLLADIEASYGNTKRLSKINTRIQVINPDMLNY